MNHGKTLDDRNAIRLGKVLGMLPMDVIGYMQEDRAQSEEIKNFWTNQLPRLLPSFAIAVTASLWAGQGALNDGQLSGTNAVPYNIATLRTIYYAHLGSS
jgi:hypothetical protein